MSRKGVAARRGRSGAIVASRRKFVVVSKPGAVLLVERIELSPAELNGLTVDAVRISGNVENQQSEQVVTAEAA